MSNKYGKRSKFTIALCSPEELTRIRLQKKQAKQIREKKRKQLYGEDLLLEIAETNRLATEVFDDEQ